MKKNKLNEVGDYTQIDMNEKTYKAFKKMVDIINDQSKVLEATKIKSASRRRALRELNKSYTLVELQSLEKVRINLANNNLIAKLKNDITIYTSNKHRLENIIKSAIFLVKEELIDCEVSELLDILEGNTNVS